MVVKKIQGGCNSVVVKNSWVSWGGGGRRGRDHEGGYRVLEVTFITVRCAQFSRL